MPTFKRLLILAGLIGGMAQAHAGTQQDFDTDTLSEGKISILDLSKPAGVGKSFLAATIIDAPVPKLCAIILNFPDYPSFMPNMDKTTVVESSDNISVMDMTLKLPLGKSKKYRLKTQSTASRYACNLSWKMVPRPDLKPEETIADTTGYWKLVPLPADANKTIVRYFVYSDPGPVPFGLGWIVDAMGKDSLPKTLEALRNKAAPK